LVKTSAYTLEETVEKFENACHSLIDGNVQEYVSMLKDIEDELKNTVAKYPEDDEIKEFFADFKGFLKDKKSGELVDEKDRLSKFLSDMKKHIVHWRKLDVSSGKDLQFKDYRSLRGDAGTRR